MTTPTPVDVSPASPTPRTRHAGVRWDRVAIGILLTAVGAGWLLDAASIPVPWRVLPAAAVIMVGAALLLTLTGGTGRGNLVTLGVVLSIIAIAVAVGAGRFAGPVGERVIVAGTGTWPDRSQLAAGSLTVDLTRGPLPADGRMTVGVGAGRVELHLPADRPVRVEAEVVMGKIAVGGTVVEQGIDLDWTDPSTAAAPLVVAVEVGMGDVEVIRAHP